MAVQIQGFGGVVAEVDGTTFRALRATLRPVDYGALGMYRVGVLSGVMAAALGANSEIFQFRWVDATRFGAIYAVTISAGMNVAATAAALASFNLTRATAWSSAGTGGTRLVLTGNLAKLRISGMGTSLVNDAGISTTAALGAGTKTLDATNMGAIAVGIGTGAITTSPTLPIIGDTKLFDADGQGQHPLILATNEGFVIRIANAFPATMTWHFGVNVVWAEVPAF